VFYDHVRTHIRPERVLECPTASCPFVTEYRHHLELHLRNHLNSRPIRCPICPYRCAVSSMLASHLKSHTKVHRFRCAVCRFSSKFSNALKRHLVEKGHARGYVLNADGSIPDGGAVPFEPGSPPSTRLRQRATAGAKTTTVTTTSDTRRNAARCTADATSEVTFSTDAQDVKAAIWTPPVTASAEMNAGPRMASWRPRASGDDLLPLKRGGGAALGTSLPCETQTASLPPLPPPSLPPLPPRPPPPPPSALTISTAVTTLGARSLCACAVCGLDAGGYVELAQHMMTSHYAAMTSGRGHQSAAAAVATTPLKRRWPGGDSDEPVSAGWTPPSLPAPPVNERGPCHAPPYDLADVRRQFVQPMFATKSSTLSLHHAAALSSYHCQSPVLSTALGSLSCLRAELDALRSAEGRSLRGADEASTMTSQHLSRVKSDDAPTSAPPSNFTDVNSPRYWHKTSPPSDYGSQTPAPLPAAGGWLP